MTVHPTAIRVRPPRPRRSRLLVFVVVAALLLLILPSLVTFAAEWPWFQALGYQRVFATCGLPSAAPFRTRWSFGSPSEPPAST
jgi:hypothetical protein